MASRFVYVPFLLSITVASCGGAWFPRSAQTSFLNENLTKVQRIAIQRVEASKYQVKKKIDQLSKESETLSKAEREARDRLKELEDVAVAVAETRYLSQEVGNRVSEQIIRTEQAVIEKLETLEEAAKNKSRFQTTFLETKVRDKLLLFGNTVEGILNNLFNRHLPSEVPVVRRTHVLSDKTSERLINTLIGLVLLSAFGNLSGQMKAWDVWEEAGGAFGDQYFPFPVDFVAKRTLAGVLELIAAGLLITSNAAKDITTSLGSVMAIILFGRVALIHEAGFMVAFSSITTIVAAIVLLNEL